MDTEEELGGIPKVHITIILYQGKGIKNVQKLVLNDHTLAVKNNYLETAMLAQTDGTMKTVA